MLGLHYGFWPFAEVPEHYPEICDNSIQEPKTERERDFLRTHILKEEAAGRFSPSFGPHLLPGMYSLPIHVVLWPQDDKLCLVVDHSYGKYSLNSMISHKDITGVRLNGLRTFGASLIAFHTQHPNTELIM